MAEPSSSSAAITTTCTSSSPSSSQRLQGRELQGPRPAPLRVRRDYSDKHNKMRRRHQHQVHQVRQPVIIYTVSPKVVHAEPSEFMSVVQRLTGAPATASADTTTTTTTHHQHSLSFPFPPPQLQQFPFQLHHQQAAAAGIIHHHQQDTTGVADAEFGGHHQLPSILSPVPGSLPAVLPSFFSPPTAGAGGGDGINLFGELISPSPAFLGATTGNPPSPTSQMYPATATLTSSPLSGGAYYWDLFNNHQQKNNL